MQIVVQYNKGQVLFTAPSDSGRRHHLPRIPWGVTVYYDPPIPSVYASMKCEEGRLTLGLRGHVSKAPARCLIDTGASGTHYISKQFCKQIGLTFTEQDQQTITMADGTSAQTLGTVTVPVQIQSYRAKLTCSVMDMTPEYDLILGDQWLITNQAVIDYAERTCSIQQGNRRLVMQTNPAA